MSDEAMFAKIRELGISDTRKSGRVELPNHHKPDPMKPDFAKVNRKNLWWIRRGHEWRVA